MMTALKRTGYALLAILALNLLTWAVWGRSTDLVVGIQSIEVVAQQTIPFDKQDTLIIGTGKLPGDHLEHQMSATPPSFHRRLARLAEQEGRFGAVWVTADTLGPGHDVLQSSKPVPYPVSYRLAFIPYVLEGNRAPLWSQVDVLFTAATSSEHYGCQGVWVFRWLPMGCEHKGTTG